MPRQHMRIGGIGRKIATDIRARYHAAMKKSTLKLVIRRETLRLLAGMDLVRVGGGNADAQQLDTGNAGTGCPNVKLVDSEGPVTGCVKP
jgi:hypothetical protein